MSENDFLQPARDFFQSIAYELTKQTKWGWLKFATSPDGTVETEWICMEDFRRVKGYPENLQSSCSELKSWLMFSLAAYCKRGKVETKSHPEHSHLIKFVFTPAA